MLFYNKVNHRRTCEKGWKYAIVSDATLYKNNERSNENRKTETEDRRMMYLYADKLVTKYREFPIDHVIDMSFRAFGTTGGLLYVYTSSGVFSYTVTSSPAEFIQAFKTYFHI